MIWSSWLGRHILKKAMKYLGKLDEGIKGTEIGMHDFQADDC
jgi:hypothetical protein